MRVTSVSMASMANYNSKKRVDNSRNQQNNKTQSGTPSFSGLNIDQQMRLKVLGLLVFAAVVIWGGINATQRKNKIEHSEQYLIEQGKQEAREELLKNKGRAYIMDSIKNTLEDSLKTTLKDSMETAKKTVK